jgi:hypothetical protein
MPKKTIKKTSSKRITTKKTNIAKNSKGKVTRDTQAACSGLIMIGTGVLIVIVLFYISFQYFLV